MDNSNYGLTSDRIERMPDLICNVRKIPHHLRVEMLADLQRKRVAQDHLEVLLLDAMAADPEPYPGDKIACEKEYVREEVAAIQRVAPITAGKRLHVASQLTARFPNAVEAMQDGLLPGYFATRLVELTEALSDVHAAKVEKRVLPRVGQQTLGQFTTAIRRAVLAVDPATAEEKHERSRADRRLVFNPPTDDGMVELWALLPADQAAELRARVDALADTWKTSKSSKTDCRTADQRRADALCALGADTAPLKPSVHVGIALSTLLGLDDKPGEIDGDPVAASIARALAFDPAGRWRRILTDDCGYLVDVSSDTYEVPAPLKRFLEVRDRTCQFPGCSRTAARCDKDHRRPWRLGGPTSATNLCCLCKRHHNTKHDAGWTYNWEADRTIVWTSPNKQTFKRPPPEPPPF